MTWNFGAWFGNQIGGTVWMLIAGMLTAIRDLQTGMIVMVLFIVPNIIGTALWITRELSCHASTQIVIGASGICGLATVYYLERANTWMHIQSGSQLSAQSTYWIIGLVCGGLMLVFYFRFGRSTNAPDD